MKEATTSLIDTNVALRKEIRESQLILSALSDSEERFRDLTETTSDFIWESDKFGLYTYASPKSKKLLDIMPEELVGRPLLLLVGKNQKDLFHKPFAKVEYEFNRRDGRQVIIESSGEPVFSKRNEFLGFRGIDRDVTERKIHETSLKLAKQTAESANVAKSDFLANMSHALRTPLHAILSFARYGEKRINSASKNDLLHFFKQINISGSRLIPLINNLLDLSKLESGKMIYNIQQQNLRKEILAATQEVTPLAEKKSLEVKIPPENNCSIAYFDAVKIEQVLRNLISNAIIYSHENSTIRIHYFFTVDQNNQKIIQTTIGNFGILIPAAETESIFDKFVQSSKTNTGAGGTGLGLSICKTIIEDHRGNIWTERTDNGETLFHFTLPVVGDKRHNRDKMLRSSSDFDISN